MPLSLLLLFCHGFVLFVTAELNQENRGFVSIEEFQDFKVEVELLLKQKEMDQRHRDLEINSLRERVYKLEERVQQQAEEQSVCSGRLAKLETSSKNTPLSKTINGKPCIHSKFGKSTKDLVRNDSIKLKSRIFYKQRQGNRKRSIGDEVSFVAFFARSSTLSDLGANQIITFSNATTNIGNLYNSNTGVFYCDVPGTYVFSVTIVSKLHKNIFAHLSRNGRSEMYIYSGSTQQGYGSGSNTGVIHLQRGDSVMVKIEYAVTGEAIDDWSYFSGFYFTRLSEQLRSLIWKCL